MLNLNFMPSLQGFQQNALVLLKVYPSVGATLLFFVLACAGLLFFAIRKRRQIAQQARFDLELWERTLSLVFQHRVKDAVALCDLSVGAFPLLYKTGLEAASTRQSAADSMSFLREEYVERLRGGLALLIALGFLCPFVGLLTTFEGTWKIYQATLSFDIGLLRLFPYLLSTAAGIFTAVCSGGIYVYFSLNLRRLNSQFKTCALKLSLALAEESAAAARGRAGVDSPLGVTPDGRKVSDGAAAAKTQSAPVPPMPVSAPVQTPSQPLERGAVPAFREANIKEGTPKTPAEPVPAGAGAGSAPAPKPSWPPTDVSIWETLPHHL